MSKVYAVEVSTVFMVVADDMGHVYEMVDRRMVRDVLADAGDDGICVEYVKQVKDVASLEDYGWAGNFIPYGDTDGNTTLEEILKG